MKAAPALQVTVDRFGVSRLALAVLISCGAASFAGWCAGRVDAWRAVAQGDESMLLALTASWAMAGVAALLAAVSRLRFEPFDLRWDGECWYVRPAGRPLDEPLAGQVDVAVDLGRWLLLRFHPLQATRRHRVRWMPIQRSGLEAPWPALRATLYGAVQRVPRLSSRSVAE